MQVVHSVLKTILHDRPVGGDLFNALHRGHKGNLTWHKRSANPADPLPANPVQGLGKRIALDIARGLHFLHTHRIVSAGCCLDPSMHMKAYAILASVSSIAAASELTKYSMAAVTPACLWNRRSFKCNFGMQRSLLAIMQVHMDVKSPNVLLGRNNLAKLADVGLAKFLHKDYLSVAKSVGTFAWSVSPSYLPEPDWQATTRRPPSTQS